MASIGERMRQSQQVLEADEKARAERNKGPDQPPNEQRAYQQLLIQARRAGATLQNEGKGGLPSSLVLGVMKRDEFRCKRCGGQENLTMHHKAGIVESAWLSRKGHANEPNALVTLCAHCHDVLHNDAKAAGLDSSQLLPQGDVGTRRDKGQPVAVVDEQPPAQFA